jgi:hypothetical protein
MDWVVEEHESYSSWFAEQDKNLQDEILAVLILLKREGPTLDRPRADTIKASQYSNMKELRVQYCGEPWRILFAFDPKRTAILLLGGNKTGNNQWYKENIPIADQRFTEHLEKLKRKRKDDNTRTKDGPAQPRKKGKNRGKS